MNKISMNHCKKIHYRVYTVQAADFENMVESLLQQLPEGEVVLRLIFFGSPLDNEQYVFRRSLLWKKVESHFRNKLPATSYVSQPPLNAGLTLEVHSYEVDVNDIVCYRKSDSLSYVLLTNEEGCFMYAGGFQGDNIQDNIEKQSTESFKKIKKILRKEGFPINSIVRQWNYIERITQNSNKEGQHYQIFNNARGNFYSLGSWSNGYPAATGIGASLGGVLVDFDAAVLTSPYCFVTPIDNNLQVAAHSYSLGVLKKVGEKNFTPKFERAKSITFGDDRFIYISGTAAIRGEHTLVGVGLKRQLQVTIENISQLIGSAQLCMLRVYLKEKSFYEEAHELIEQYKLNIPISYMQADVCREELLIEIEGIAVGNRSGL